MSRPLLRRQHPQHPRFPEQFQRTASMATHVEGSEQGGEPPRAPPSGEDAGGGSLARRIGLTILAIVAFAANSVLCRRALHPPTIDAASFATVRLASGAVTLTALLALGSARGQTATRRTGRTVLAGGAGSWSGAAWLFLYAAPFSFAYVSLSTGTGALLLFGAVQLTMMGAAVLGGERLTAPQWLGIAVAALGLVWLVLPGVSSPPLFAASLMALAGVAWGAYSLKGRSAADPLALTAGNFVRATPMALAVSAVAWAHVSVTASGLGLAAASGALASGLGYAVWYAVLPSLRASQAASVQLLVPVVAAVGGVVFVGERVDARLATSAVAIVGGVFFALRANLRARPTRDKP